MKELALESSLPNSANLMFHLAPVFTAVLGITIRRPPFHQMLAMASPALMGTYVLMLFARLN